jgi:hypothetical protein
VFSADKGVLLELANRCRRLDQGAPSRRPDGYVKNSEVWGI